MKTKKIVVLGSTNTDMVITGKKIPVPGETILGGLSSMIQQREGIAILPGMTFCCLFLAILNAYLRKKFV